MVTNVYVGVDYLFCFAHGKQIVSMTIMGFRCMFLKYLISGTERHSTGLKLSPDEIVSTLFFKGVQIKLPETNFPIGNKFLKAGHGKQFSIVFLKNSKASFF